MKRNKILTLKVRAQVLIKEAKKTKTHPIFDAIHKKLKSKAMQLFVLIYKIFCMFRGFEQLSSAICWRVMTCSICATSDTWWLLNDLCAPFLHYALSEEKHSCKPVWRSDKFPLWHQSHIRKRFSVNKECTWVQKVYNSIICVSNKLNEVTDVCCGIRNASAKMMTKSFVKQNFQYCERSDEFQD